MQLSVSAHKAPPSGELANAVSLRGLASPGRGKLSPQVTDEGAAAGITPHPALCATFPPRGEGFSGERISTRLLQNGPGLGIVRT